MADIVLQCKRKAETAIYNHLVREGYVDRLDNGFRVLNYNDPFRPKDNLEGAGDGKVVCEELWENTLILLDELGESESTRQKYEELRRIIETQTRRPIPWVLDEPKIRRKIGGAVDALNKILADIKKQDEAKYQRCLIACLYWFVFVGENSRIVPPDFISFLEKKGIGQDSIHKITNPFSDYLQKTGGGLGLMKMGNEDAALEATALETVLQAKQKKGWCTEQSKVMYAVLHMAGVETFFVESHPSVEYFRVKGIPAQIPLPGHVASGVGVKVIDKNGKEKVWIVDMALKQLEADYIFDGPGWKAHPYWELSLRHFFMVDLANLGRNQTQLGDFTGAERNLLTALQMGEDSTAFYAMGNFAYLLSKKAQKFSPRSETYKQMDQDIDKYSKAAVERNPDNPTFQFNRGIYLANKKDWANWEEMILAFLNSIDADPRYVEPYQKLGQFFCDIRKNFPNEFSKAWGAFKKRMHKVVKKHPSLNGVIRNGLEAMQKAIPFKKPFRKEIIDLIEKMKWDLIVW